MNYQVPQIEWIDQKKLDENKVETEEWHRSIAETLIHAYQIMESMTEQNKVMVHYYNKQTRKGEPYISCPNFNDVSEAKEWVEKIHYPSALIKAGFKPVSEPLIQRDRIIQAVNTLTDICHSASRNAGWWHNIKTGESLKRNKGEMLMLMVSELAEAMEADRKSLQDDHLPQYDGVSVEMADCLIRICDFVGGFGLKTAEAMAEKIEYNANRADHKIENRLKDNGKKY